MLVEERAHPVEHEQWRLRRRLATTVSTMSSRRHPCDPMPRCAAGSISCGTAPCRTSARTEPRSRRTRSSSTRTGARRPRRRAISSPVSSSTACSRAVSRGRSRPRGSSPRARRTSSGRTCASCAATRLSEIPPERLEEEFVHAFRGIVPNDKRFLGGETIGELFDRVLPALDRFLADESWDTVLAVLHGAVNRAILSYALTAERMFLGHFEQAPAASTCSTSARDGLRSRSCARSTSRRSTSSTRRRA